MHAEHIIIITEDIFLLSSHMEHLLHNAMSLLCKKGQMKHRELQMRTRALNVNSADSSCPVPLGSWMGWWEVDSRWCRWVPFPLPRLWGVDVHDVVVALLKSIHVAQIDVDSRGKTRKCSWAGKLTLQTQKSDIIYCHCPKISSCSKWSIKHPAVQH